VVIRLWHDDIRPAPEGWIWVRTNEAAREILADPEVEVVEISLDHDLGLDHFSEEEIEADPELIFARGEATETGLDLVRWMCETGNVPETIKVHSWNIEGARAMSQWFNDHGHTCLLAPFVVAT
jgi:hypothetical protein